jgi:hypothetical protein
MGNSSITENGVYFSAKVFDFCGEDFMGLMIADIGSESIMDFWRLG